MMQKAWLVPLVAAVLLAGLSSLAMAGGGEGFPIGTRWVLESLGGCEMVAGTEITMEFPRTENSGVRPDATPTPAPTVRTGTHWSWGRSAQPA